MAIARFSQFRVRNSVCVCSPLLHKAVFFSSSAALTRRPWAHFRGDPEEFDGESSVYKRALKLQRPSTVRFEEIFFNSVSLIGTICRPLINCKTSSGRFGVSTLLQVSSSSCGHGFILVMLVFWEQLAEIAVEHLKLDDLIYVSGSIASYKKMDKDGKSMYHYQVEVTEVNFVAQYLIKTAVLDNTKKLEPKVSVEDIIQKRRARLHLWHIFFSSPEEWWDNRFNKPNPKHPDFKHKDTGEVLWLNYNDPPWIRKQLQVHDSRFYKRSTGKHANDWSFLSPLAFDNPRRS